MLQQRQQRSGKWMIKKKARAGKSMWVPLAPLIRYSTPGSDPMCACQQTQQAEISQKVIPVQESSLNRVGMESSAASTSNDSKDATSGSSQEAKDR